MGTVIDLTDDSTGSETEEELAETYLDCGLPLLDGSVPRPCRACGSEFRMADVRQISDVWTLTKEHLAERGYHAFFPTMDDHFKKVFILFVKDWQGRLDEVSAPYDSDPEYVFHSEEDTSDTLSDENSE